MFKTQELIPLTAFKYESNGGMLQRNKTYTNTNETTTKPANGDKKTLYNR